MERDKFFDCYIINMLFSDMANYYSKLESTSSRISMVEVMKDAFKQAEKDEIRNLIYLTKGMLAPPFENIEIGIAEKMAAEAISITTGVSREEVEKEFKKEGDLGVVAEKLMGKNKVRQIKERRFKVNEVYEALKKIAMITGEGSQQAKLKTLSELLASCSPKEAKYIIRFVLGELRLGVGDATILEALASAYTGNRKNKSLLENAYNICSDLGKVGEEVANKGIEGIKGFKVSLFNPIRPALAERLPTAEEILKRMGGIASVESKYDGLRAQVHLDKKQKKVEIFSRNLERLTPMLPDIVEAAMKEIRADEAIIDGEAIAYNEVEDLFYPFQETIQRKRKHGVEEKSKELPLHLFAFDIMYLDGKDLLSLPYSERRKKLEEVAKGDRIRPTDRIVAKSPRELERYFENVVSKGLEGIVAKDMNAPYVAGARKFSWIKLKRSYKGELSDSLDLVIVGYYLGRGTRAEFQFGGLLCAIYDKKKDMFETITRIGTGFTEEMMKELKEELDKIKVSKKPARVDSLIEPDFWVEPRYVVTVKADEITKSPMHTAGREGETGYALRFPRIVGSGIRRDKSPEDATTLEEVMKMYKDQKKVRVEEQQ
ncbi:MAG: ATP-dependent DNA ligase [Candidatus Micrarchaeaceae archaeon]